MRSFQSLKFQIILLALACPYLVLACTGCDDDPVRPINNLPACWKPLVLDTAGIPNPAPGLAQSIPAWSHSGGVARTFVRVSKDCLL